MNLFQERVNWNDLKSLPKIKSVFFSLTPSFLRSFLHEIYVYKVLACDCVDARGKCWASSSCSYCLKTGLLTEQEPNPFG